MTTQDMAVSRSTSHYLQWLWAAARLLGMLALLAVWLSVPTQAAIQMPSDNELGVNSSIITEALVIPGLRDAASEEARGTAEHNLELYRCVRVRMRLLTAAVQAGQP